MYRRQFLYLSTAATTATLLAPMSALAQLHVTVTGVGRTQIPVAIVDFRGEQLLNERIGSIVRADLLRSGMFTMVSVDQTLDEASRIPNNELRGLGIDAILTGSVKSTANGLYEIKYRLWDAATNKELANAGLQVKEADLRLAAHRIADTVFEKILGQPGAFASRIAYIVKSGGAHVLYVADSDGARAQAIYRSASPLISPTWSFDGSQLAYVSFELKKPIIYSHQLASGKRAIVANYKGSNSAPAWSNSGSMAAVLSLSGYSQIYAIDGKNGAPKRLTRTAGIDTQPVYSKDGQHIYFVSDRGGSPQIYRMGANGGGAERITFNGSYSVDPALSPDGKWLAYIGREQGRFNVYLQNLATGDVSRLTDSSADTKPSFAPNSLLVLYSTIHNGRETMMNVTLDGQVKTPLTIAGAAVKEAVWGERI